ncbi:MAG: glycosyltransferase family A protein [Bryobacteraceae bacterium]
MIGFQLPCYDPRLARKAGAGVVRAPEVPRGAARKAHTSMAGARLLTSKWILFADADAWFDPGFLDAAALDAVVEDVKIAMLARRHRLRFGAGTHSAGARGFSRSPPERPESSTPGPGQR